MKTLLLPEQCEQRKEEQLRSITLARPAVTRMFSERMEDAKDNKPARRILAKQRGYDHWGINE